MARLIRKRYVRLGLDEAEVAERKVFLEAGDATTAK